jgi:hypothetical protein
MVVAGVGALALAGCGGSEAGGVVNPEPATIELPEGADDVLVRLGDGDFPTLLIAGDGSVFQLDDQIPADFGGEGFAAIAPLPPSPAPVVRRQLTETGLQIVFQRAEELGLLDTPPEYESPNVTDSGSTSLTLRDAHGTYEHRAYALGFDDPESDRDRRALLSMVEDLGDLEALVGRNISDLEPYVPDTYHVRTGTLFTGEEGQAWPEGVPVEEGCVRLPIERFPAGVSGTYRYVGGDGEVQIWVAPDLPGDDC